MSEHREMLGRDPISRQARPEPESDALIHFTSDSMALKILRNGPWLFDATTGNDHAEHFHGIEFLWRTLPNSWAFTREEAQAMSTSFTDPTCIDLTRLDRI